MLMKKNFERYERSFICPTALPKERYGEKKRRTQKCFENAIKTNNKIN